MLGLLILMAAGQVEAAVPQATRPPREESPALSVCAALQVTSPETPASRSQVFSATKILDLEIGALMTRQLSGEHVLELKVFTPRGHLYQSMSVPFAARAGAGPATAPRMRSVDGYSRPLVEQPMQPVRSGGQVRYLVGTRLPVAGTSIMTSSLYGRWKVEAFLDGALTPCGPAKTFSLTQ